MLSKHPDLNGIWAVWDVPAEGVINAARASGRAICVIVTDDLGQERGHLARPGRHRRARRAAPVRPGRDRGQAGRGACSARSAAVRGAARAAGHQDNVLEAWQEVYHQDPPQALASSFTVKE